jgi:hypothetical protein
MKDLRIAFVGPSGAGKSTCYGYAADVLASRGYMVHRCDAARPLRDIQAYAYRQFGLPSPGDPDDAGFRQDGRLLGLLAQHFEPHLGTAFERLVRKLASSGSCRPLPCALINTDCRNNAYLTLQKLGFTCIRIETPPDILAERRKARGDLTPYDPAAAVEQTSDIKESYRILNDGTLAELEARVRAVIDACLAKH